MHPYDDIGDALSSLRGSTSSYWICPPWLPSNPHCPPLQGQETPTPEGRALMCAYKLCRVEFKYWGMQSKIEKFIHDVGECHHSPLQQNMYFDMFWLCLLSWFYFTAATKHLILIFSSCWIFSIRRTAFIYEWKFNFEFESIWNNFYLNCDRLCWKFLLYMYLLMLILNLQSVNVDGNSSLTIFIFCSC